MEIGIKLRDNFAAAYKRREFDPFLLRLTPLQHYFHLYRDICKVLKPLSGAYIFSQRIENPDQITGKR